MATSSELSYIAGFFDGEGSVVITKSGRDSDVPSSLDVTISQKKPEILEWIKSATGLGFVNYNEKQDIYRIRFNGYMAGSFLSLIVLYLKDKRREAEIGIKYATLLHSQNPKSLTGPRLTEKQKEERRFFYSELMACRWGYA